MSSVLIRGLILVSLISFLTSLLTAATSIPSSNEAASLYQQLQNSTAIETGVHLENVALHRDRVTIKFVNGTVYLSPPIAGKVRAAVFIGAGEFQASPPPVLFEQENVRRLLKADDVSSDFRTAVLRFTDDTAAEIAANGSLQNTAGPQAVIQLAAELAPRLLKETGANISSRQLESILNQEGPGIFLIQMDGGKRGRFTYVFDPQTHIPVSAFDINAGEKGIIFAHDQYTGYDIWLAFHTLDDYARGIATYSDVYNLADTKSYALTLDLMEPKKILGESAQLEMVSRVDGLRVIPFAVGESLRIDEDERRKKQLRVLEAELADGSPLTFFQEPWEAGFTIVLPRALAAGERLTLKIDLKGEFMMESSGVTDTYFPRSSDRWYPRHGYLPRASFDVSMIHRKRDKVVSIGSLIREEPAPDTKDAILTEFRMDQPVPLATFAVGPYEIHKDIAKQISGKELPIEFYSMPGSRLAIKEDFIVAELNNCVRYFSQMFGEYPYPLFRGAFHPFNYGQGFATTIMIPGTDRATNRTYSFIAHETSHQWWGDQVLWRSYRDQWLSEGFAEYSGMLYVLTREDIGAQRNLIQFDRQALKDPPVTLHGIGAGRLTDVGPLVMGHRLETRETFGAYSALVYDKGALVLRMLHFLFTDPQTGDGRAFFDLMRDFVQRHQGGTASTEQFFTLANERVKDTSLAKKYGYNDLNWFYRQWVTQTYLPSYELVYHIEDTAAAGTVLKGDLYQKGLPEGETWFMPLPLLIHFHGGTVARATIAVQGAHTPITLKLPRLPEKVELDPELWVLSEKTSITKQGWSPLQ